MRKGAERVFLTGYYMDYGDDHQATYGYAYYVQNAGFSDFQKLHYSRRINADVFIWERDWSSQNQESFVKEHFPFWNENDFLFYWLELNLLSLQLKIPFRFIFRSFFIH